MDNDSQGISWKRVDKDTTLSKHPCELIYANMEVSGAVTDTHLRNGVDSSADIVHTFKRTTVDDLEFKPGAPIFCDKGLFADIGSGTTGLLVIWRVL